MPHGHVWQPRALEGVDRVDRAAHHRLPVEIERGIEHGTHAGAALELADDGVVLGIPRALEDLRPFDAGDFARGLVGA